MHSVSIDLPNHTRVPIQYVGSVVISPSFTLPNIFYVPHFKVILISVSALIHNTDFIVSYYPKHFVIQENNLKKIGRGEYIDGLYYLKSPSRSASKFVESTLIFSVLHLNNMHCTTFHYIDSIVPSRFVFLFTFSIKSHSLWHASLGHLSNKRLVLLQSTIHCTFLEYNKAEFCSICALAKQKRVSFVSSNKFVENYFNLIHFDIWGPFHVSTISGHRYFITIVDDDSQYTRICLLKAKSKANSAIIAFFSLIKTQFEVLIKANITDNAKELQMSVAPHGVLHKFSCVESPNKILLLKGGTKICLMWQGLYISNPRFLWLSKVIMYPLRHILLIPLRPLIPRKKHHIIFYTTGNLFLII